MAWTFSDGTPYDGPVHTLRDTSYSGATRTKDSRRLIQTPDLPQPKPAAKKKAAPRKKQPPKPKGATAWD